MLTMAMLAEIQSQGLASLIFGGILLVYVLLVFLFGPKEIPPYKERTFAIIAALLAGLFGFFLTGSITLKIEPNLAGWGKTAIQAGGGVALFVFVLWWWGTPKRKKNGDGNGEDENENGDEARTKVVIRKEVEVEVKVKETIIITACLAFIVVLVMNMLTGLSRSEWITAVGVIISAIGIIATVILYIPSKKKEAKPKLSQAERLDKTNIALMQHVLFNDRHKNYEVWFHCYYPKHNLKEWEKIKADLGPGNSIQGGWSGFLSLKDTFHKIRPSGDHKILNVGKCDVEGEEPPFKEKHKSCKKLGPNKENNLYLLDAPFARSKKNKVRPLNWLMRDIIKKLEQRFPDLTVHMEIIDPSNSKDAELAKEHPDEQKTLRYDGVVREVASSVWDYGFVVRAPNPYNKEAVVLMMAGLHAPATHAAAEVFSIPSRMKEFAEDIKKEWKVDLLKINFFEAVFKVRRTLKPDELGKVEWLHFRQLLDGIEQ